MATAAIAAPAPEQATLSRSLGPAAGPTRTCDLCGARGPARTVTDRIDGRAVAIRIGSRCCFVPKFLVKRDHSALHKAFTTARAMQAGAPAAPPVGDWRQQVARLKAQTAAVAANAPRRTGGRR